MNLGVILILFILLVILIPIFCPFENNLIANQARSIGFNVNNEIGSYDLAARSLGGDFEPPAPILHTIPSRKSYNFQVLADGNTPTSAFVNYNIDFRGQIAGTVTIMMTVIYVSYWGIRIPVGKAFTSINSDFVTATVNGTDILIHRIL
ncbi:hypothetical protein M3223_01705 [Paenibacillus pasadenensis]|uniref:hypothetical protein n=1 Tax=Paenibacillus pasadenensis TaxID=217090 RepID=UPI00203DDA94|nr:hypothetical protein [Paenibacillus pasadenensis]MCM3746063.1 hypothetical protein [Paenibacillus pasadenensis]